MKNELILFKSEFWYMIKRIFILMFILIILASFVSSDVNDDLILILNLDESSGNALDTSGNNRTFIVDATQNQLAKNSTFGTAYFFDGISNELVRTHESWMNFGSSSYYDFSICWFQNLTVWGSRETIFSTRLNGGNTRINVDEHGGNLTFVTKQADDTTIKVSHIPITPIINNWIQFCIIRNESGARLTIIEDNYEGVTTKTGTGKNIAVNVGFYIGKLMTENIRHITGRLDEIVIWNRSIGAEEINWHYNHQYPYVPPDITFLSFSDNRTNATSTTPKINNVLQINITVTDNIDIDMVKLATNQTGTLTNISTQTFTGGSDTSITVIFNLSINITRGLMEWQIWANDSSNNINVSQLFTVEIQNTPPTTPIIYYPVNNNNYSDISYINFSSIDNDNDIITYYIYINNTLNITTTVNITDWNANDGFYNLTISAYDNIIFSDNISILFLLDSTSPIITITSINLTYNETYNTNIWINFTTSEISVCSVNSTYFNISSDYGTNFIWYENTLPDEFYHLNISCNDTVLNIGYKIIYFTKDITMPVINSISPLEDNTSSFENIGNIIIEFNVTDNIDLYIYHLAIKELLLDTLIYYESSIISGTYYSYLKNIDTLNWSNVTYLEKLEVCDSHTLNKIPDLNIIKKNDTLKFQYDKIIIEIKSINGNELSVNSKKLKDRYTFDFYYDKKGISKVYELSSNADINYLPFSKYKGHFIIGNILWIDFNIDNDVFIEKTDNKYLIYIDNKEKDISFSSIGFLNCVTEHYQFNLTAILPPPLPLTLSQVMINTNTILLFSLFVFIQLFLLFISIRFNLPIILVLGSLMGILISLGFIRYVSLSQAFRTSLVIYIFINVILILTVAYGKIKE